MQNESWHCLDLITMTSHERHHLDRSICLCTIPIYASMSLIPSHICQSPMLCALMHPHAMTFAFASVANESLDGSFGTENSKSIFPGNKLKCGLIWVQHTFPLSFWLSEMSSGPKNPAASLHRIDIQVANIQVAFLDAAADCGKWQWFSEVLLSPCGYIYHPAAWWFLMQCHLRGQRSSTFTWGFLLCPTCTVISLDSLNLFTILRVIVGERPKLFAILHCEMWFVWHFSHEIWHKVMSHDPALLAKTICSFYTQTWYLDLLPIHLWTVPKQFNVDIL